MILVVAAWDWSSPRERSHIRRYTGPPRSCILAASFSLVPNDTVPQPCDARVHVSDLHVTQLESIQLSASLLCRRKYIFLSSSITCHILLSFLLTIFLTIQTTRMFSRRKTDRSSQSTSSSNSRSNNDKSSKAKKKKTVQTDIPYNVERGDLEDLLAKEYTDTEWLISVSSADNS